MEEIADIGSSQAIAAFAALAHEHRLGLYRMLVEAGPQGLNAGTLAQRLDVPPSSLTFHIQHLHRAGLIVQRRKGRELIYSTDYTRMVNLVGFLTENCCSRPQTGDAASTPAAVCCDE